MRTPGYIKGFVQLIPGSYKSNRTINITGFDKVHLKTGFISGSILDGLRQPILFSFATDKPPGHKFCEEPKSKLFKKLNKAVLSLITLYLEDDDLKPVDYNGETISFTCQLNER